MEDNLEQWKKNIENLLTTDKDFRIIIFNLFDEILRDYFRKFEKKIDNLEKRISDMDSKIEGVQFLTKEEIITLKQELKTVFQNKF